MLTVGEALDGAARRYPDKVALIFGDQQRTYRQVVARANQMAWLMLRQGLKPGDRVALLLPNGLAMAEAYFALAKAGVVGVPLNLRWQPGEILYAIRDADVSLVLADRELAPLVSGAAGMIPVFYTGGYPEDPDHDWEALADREPSTAPPVTVRDSDPWVIVYTSGTTGRPKGAVRSHFSNVMIALSLVSELGITHDDVGFAILPMFHVNSMWFVTLSLAVGATCVIYAHRAFHPQHVIDAMNHHRVTYSMFVPSLLTFLADAVEQGKIDPTALRVMMTSSAPLDVTLRDRILKGFPKVALYDVYGSTEYGAVTIIRHQLGGVLGSVGYPVIGQEVRILDEHREPVPWGTVGELYVRGPSLMTEYWRKPEATREVFTEDGFLTVGDMGYMTEEGLIYLVDRKQDMIIVAGENVYPTEVENVLLSHPAVALAAVVGVPDPRRGERVAAMVVVREGHTLDVRELEALVRRELADYKRPYAIRVVDSLPMGPAAKVVRRLAREQWLALEQES
ncbi:MAG: class I adenylate-forming enzyme family protein [Firmicutes bacterium]|nr:class I adenylate-forming enzyme family protein [Bacillota bacterium]